MLKAQGIIKSYPSVENKRERVQVVKNVSVTLEDDRTTVIVGESGSGKSTLARMLSYIEPPDEGTVYLDDICISSAKSKVRRSMRGNVQLVMQDAYSSLDPRQTIGAILDEPLKFICKMPKAEREKRIVELIKMVQLDNDVLKRRPNELSGGQQKRICVARALASEPKHIIFDESFSGLDVTVKKQVLSLLRELRKKPGLSFLIITHDLDTAMYMADVIHVMRNGEIVETIEEPKDFSDFKAPYSKELVKAVMYKMQSLQA